MQFLSDEITRALNSKSYYAAVITSLTIPDICGALESNNKWATKDKYITWCDLWLSDYVGILSGNGLYSLRCCMLHNGESLHHDLPYKTIAFAIPEHGKITPSRSAISDEILVLDAELFCRDMLAAAAAWYKSKVYDPVVIRNLESAIELSPMGPSGFSPMIWDGRAFGSKRTT